MNTGSAVTNFLFFWNAKTRSWHFLWLVSIFKILQCSENKIIIEVGFDEKKLPFSENQPKEVNFKMLREKSAMHLTEDDICMCECAHAGQVLPPLKYTPQSTDNDRFNKLTMACDFTVWGVYSVTVARNSCFQQSIYQLWEILIQIFKRSVTFFLRHILPVATAGLGLATDQASLDLTEIFLPLPQEGWDTRHVQPCPGLGTLRLIAWVRGLVSWNASPGCKQALLCCEGQSVVLPQDRNKQSYLAIFETLFL